MRCVYRNDLSELATLAADIEKFAAAEKLDTETAHAFNLCLDEVLTNIVSYGFDDNLPHQIILELNATPQEITAVISDEGMAFNPLVECKAPDLHSPIEHREIGGLGVHFVKTLMNRVAYRREGDWNFLEMAKTRPGSQA